MTLRTARQIARTARRYDITTRELAGIFHMRRERVELLCREAAESRRQWSPAQPRQAQP